jgi:hypothetical protein
MKSADSSSGWFNLASGSHKAEGWRRVHTSLDWSVRGAVHGEYVCASYQTVRYCPKNAIYHGVWWRL